MKFLCALALKCSSQIGVLGVFDSWGVTPNSVIRAFSLFPVHHQYSFCYLCLLRILEFFLGLIGCLFDEISSWDRLLASLGFGRESILFWWDFVGSKTGLYFFAWWCFHRLLLEFHVVICFLQLSNRNCFIDKVLLVIHLIHFNWRFMALVFVPDKFLYGTTTFWSIVFITASLLLGL